MLPDERRRRGRFALLAFGAAVVLFLATLPWQLRQWKQAHDLQHETAIQEARIRDLSARRAAGNDSRTVPTPGGAEGSIEAVRESLTNGDTARAAALLCRVEQIVLSDAVQRKDAHLAADLAGLFEQAGWTDHALTNAERAYHAAPRSVEALLRLGVIEASLGWQTASRKHVEAALALAPHMAEPHLAMALLENQEGLTVDAEKELRTANELRPGDPAIQRLLAANLVAQRRYDEAAALVGAALKSFPADADLLAERTDILLQRALRRAGGDRSGVEEALRQARVVQKVAPEKMEARFQAGAALLSLGDETGALQEWQAVRARQPGYPGLALRLGQLLVRRGDRTEGTRLLAEAEAARRDTAEYDRLVLSAGQKYADPERHRRLARWCQEHKRLSRAILEWEQVLRLHPDDAEARQERDRAIARRQASG